MVQSTWNWTLVILCNTQFHEDFFNKSKLFSHATDRQVYYQEHYQKVWRKITHSGTCETNCPLVESKLVSATLKFAAFWLNVVWKWNHRQVKTNKQANTLSECWINEQYLYQVSTLEAVRLASAAAADLWHLSRRRTTKKSVKQVHTHSCCNSTLFHSAASKIEFI